VEHDGALSPFVAAFFMTKMWTVHQA